MDLPFINLILKVEDSKTDLVPLLNPLIRFFLLPTLLLFRILLIKKFNDNLQFLTKFAYYDADELATDTTRFSAELNFTF